MGIEPKEALLAISNLKDTNDKIKEQYTKTIGASICQLTKINEKLKISPQTSDILGIQKNIQKFKNLNLDIQKMVSNNE